MNPYLSSTPEPHSDEDANRRQRTRILTCAIAALLLAIALTGHGIVNAMAGMNGLATLPTQSNWEGLGEFHIGSYYFFLQAAIVRLAKALLFGIIAVALLVYCRSLSVVVQGKRPIESTFTAQATCFCMAAFGAFFFLVGAAMLRSWR